MKTVVAIRHLAFEDMGILDPLLRSRGYNVHYYDAGVNELWTIDLDKVDLLVVLGGPIGAFDDEQYPFLGEEMRLIEQRLESNRPILGVCLGAQLMARALGAKVGSMGHKEIGFGELQLTEAGLKSALSPLQDAPMVLHWHGDQFEIPASAQLLASSNRCPNQAFSVGHNALGLQFHLEADPKKLEQWLIGHTGELSAAGIDPRALREQNAKHGDRLKQVAEAVFAKWLDQLER
ncbi:glutamine amidotransferase [Xenophilus sp. AP218F]|nr:glutamine amidotransferase [Chromobacterium sp. ASV5]OWY39835.1 glutamine amidotransferase [Xenophilus sp. AP218F]